MAIRPLHIALAGNPNAGKSSLFNALTGLHQKTANFPGSTVGVSSGKASLADGRVAIITDLPGTYSLYPKGEDEVLAFHALTQLDHPKYPDVVIYVADATNLKRHLVLLTQVIDLGLPTILALNMMDGAQAAGISINIHSLSLALDIPVFPIVARKGQGIDVLLERLTKPVKPSERSFLTTTPLAGYGASQNWESNALTGSAYASGLHLQNTLAYHTRPLHSEARAIQAKHPFDPGTDQRTDLLNRYKLVSSLLTGVVSQSAKGTKTKIQDRLDLILTHRFWGYVIFMGILILTFQALFSLASYPMFWIESAMKWSGSQLSTLLPAGVLNDLLVDGVWAGLTGVLVFIPQIAFLFLFIGIMEDTGYLARVAFIMDRIMRRFGLNGKSVVPLMGGVACAVPAILATRNIESPRARLITILVTPLMSCSARLPVFVLLVGILIPSQRILGIVNLQALALLALYGLGLLGVLVASLLLKWVFKSHARQYFILELPPYRTPHWKGVANTVWSRVKEFITQAGKVIVAISIVLWFLSAFGPKSSFDDLREKYPQSQWASNPGMEREYQAQHLGSSYAGMLGKFIQPVLAPLGYDWKISIAILSSFAAREVFVGTLSTLYGLEDSGANQEDLRSQLMSAKHPDSNLLVYTSASIVSLLLFYVYALQCMSTIAVTYRETGSLKFTVLQFVFMAALAYGAALLGYQVLK